MEKEPAKIPLSWDEIKKIIFMAWDGIVFFGFNTQKLKRLEGIKPGWCDRFCDRSALIPGIITFIFITYFSTREIRKFGTIISSQTKLVYNKNFEFEAKKELKLVGITNMDLASLMSNYNST